MQACTWCCLTDRWRACKACPVAVSSNAVLAWLSSAGVFAAGMAWQVPRAAQSASAFALGFFGHTAGSINTHQPLQEQQVAGDSQVPGSTGDSKHTNSKNRGSASRSVGDSSSSRGAGSQSGVLGGWRPQPVAISMLPKRHDPVLRFFESCKGYRQHEDRALRWLVSGGCGGGRAY